MGWGHAHYDRAQARIAAIVLSVGEPTVADYDDEPVSEPRSADAAEKRVFNAAENAREPAAGNRPRRLRLGVEPRVAAGAWTLRLPDARGSHSGISRRQLVATVPRFGLDVAWGVTERAFVGAELGFAVDSIETAGERRTSASARAVSYLQWLFRPEHRTRPYVELRAGLGGVTWSGASGMGATAAAAVVPMVGVGAGVHFFLRERLTAVVGSEIEYATPFTRTPGSKRAWTHAEGFVALALLLGIAVWF